MSKSQPSALPKLLTSYQERINKALSEYFASDEATFGLGLRGMEKQAFARLKEFSERPGKRVRGALALFVYEEFGGRENPSAINLALAMELIQNYLLIIDDVTDASDTRRGQPAVHVLFEELSNGSTHLANMMAVTTALLAQHMASELLCKVSEKPANIIAASTAFHKNIAATAYGQLDDIYESQNQPSKSQILRLYELKNSYYTFINPFETGSLMTGLDNQKRIQELFNIGLPAGVAFQIHDDILGLFGQKSETGKSNMDDLKEGKRTLLMYHALQKTSPAEQAVIKNALGNTKLTQQEHDNVKTLIEDSGALKQAQYEAKSYCDRALRAVELSHLSRDGKQFISDIINFAVKRRA